MDKYEKEKRGIYNVTFNEKNSTHIKTDLEIIEDVIIDYVIHYVKGWHNIKRDKGKGAKHIKLHLEKGSEGEITLEELLNLGNSIREYLKMFKEPFKDSNDARIYEWENDKRIRFRLVTDTNYKQIAKGEGHSNTPLSPSDEIIITFYSDRNINKQMEFKNSKVEEYYQQQKALQNPTANKKKVFSKNPKPTQETRDRYFQKVKEISSKIKIDKSFSSKSNDKDR